MRAGRRASLHRMRRLAWGIFWAIQIAGVLCLMGGEQFAISTAGYRCRIFALCVLEPGFILMQPLTEAAMAPWQLPLEQMYWSGVLLGVALNTLLFWLAVRIFAGKRRSAA
jgi:hypothetical protein